MLTVAFLAFFPCGQVLLGQDTTRVGRLHDPLATQMLYELGLLRLQRLLPDFWLRGDTTAVPAEVRALLGEAQNLAARKEWDAAETLLSVAADYLAGSAASAGPSARGRQEPAGAAGVRWYPELFTGLEGWQQSFAVPGEFQDTTLAEEQGNPVLGLRLGFEQGSPRTRLTDGHLEVRSSRDYQGGHLALGHRLRFGAGHYLALQNDLEGLAYREPQLPDFTRMNLRCELGYALAPQLTALLGYAGSWQRYSEAHRFYASYVAHRLSGEVTAMVAPGARLALGYEFGDWHYPDAVTRDYSDHSLRGRLFVRELFIDGITHLRRFAAPFADSLFNNDYVEGEVRAEWRHNLEHSLTLVVQGCFTARNYRFPSTTTPDFRFYELRPAVRLPAAGLGFLEIGYQLQHHAPSPSQGVPIDQFSLIDRYLSYGPSFTFEGSGRGGFVLSAAATFGRVVYPDSPTRQVSGLSVFSDRRASSLSCFLSWPWSLHWEINLLANYDADLDTKESAYYSRTSIFILELRYRF